MHSLLLPAGAPASVPIVFVSARNWPAGAAELAPAGRAFAAAQGFEPEPGRACLLPDDQGELGTVLFGLDRADAPRFDPFLPGKLPSLLPKGVYRFVEPPGDGTLATLAFLLGAYRFDRYRAPKPAGVRLVCPAGVDAADVSRVAEGVALARDLINTPASDLGPDGLEAAARDLARRHGAAVEVTTGQALLAADFAMIHAVGRASATPPRLIDMIWGEPGWPKVTIVGKGVTFDSGGLDIKPEAAMALMKKDMGGAATALGLAHMVMDAGLPVRLRILIPAVENAISGCAFRPGDVLRSRKGLSVEIGNTDAEGRLILADALALADEERPDLLIDYATLTGAARVALGPDLPALYTHDEALAGDLARLSESVNDPVWRLPLWPPYDAMLDSKIADVNHISGGPFAGSVTAALFLNRFVARTTSYAHLDLYAWNPATKPGRPEGGEAQGARLVYALLTERCAGACGFAAGA